MKIKELEEQYNKQKKERLVKIKAEPNKWKRFWKWLGFIVSFPFVWSWYNFRDWRTFLIFIIVMLVIGSEVWVPLLLGWIFKNEYLLYIAGVCEAFWLLPGTPFLPLCIAITIGIKSLYNKKISSN